MPNVERAKQLLKALVEMKDKTLIAPFLGEDCDRAHQLGANKAFGQAADWAQDALTALEE